MPSSLGPFAVLASKPSPPSFVTGVRSKSFDSHSTMFMGCKVARPAMNSAGSAYTVGLQDGSPATKESSCSSGLQEWSSPVGKNLLGISRRRQCNNCLPPEDWSGGSLLSPGS